MARARNDRCDFATAVAGKQRRLKSPGFCAIIAGDLAQNQAGRSYHPKEGKMSITTLIIWIVVGAIAGLLADYLVKGVKLGLVAAIIVGMVGALVGGFLFTQLLGFTLGGGILGDILTSLIGAVIILLVYRFIKK